MTIARKSICFVVAAPMTATAFLLNHFEVLAQKFDIYLVANFEGVNSDLKENPNLKAIYSIGIQRDIHLVKDFHALLGLKEYFKKEKFDFVFTVTPKAGFLGILAAYLAGIQYRLHIFTGQVWHTQSGLFKQILKGIDQITFKLSTQVLVDGFAQQEYLIENGVITKERSSVLGKGSISGVNSDRFILNPEVRMHLRTQLGYKNDDVVFMFLGRLNIDKGVLDLAKAFHNIQNEFSNVRLLLVGYDEENLMPIVNSITNNSEKVHFFGPTPRPNELLLASDVFCLPSHREGFGTSVIEASLLELPVLCSDTYGLRETIIENETGIRHRTGDISSITEGMRNLVSNFENRKKMGIAGRQYVLDNFTAKAISNEWLTFFKKMI